MFLLKVNKHVWGTYRKLKLKTAAKNKQKIPNFGHIYLISVLYKKKLTMCPTLGKEVQKSDNKVFKHKT